MKPGTATAHRALIAGAIDRIQRELDDEVSLDLLAESAGVSPFYFHRVFTTVVGEAPASYVRRLRLERAALRLKFTRRPVTDIAFEAGYETHESFTRAFKARFGEAPRRFRVEESCPECEIEAPLAIVRLQPRRIACVRHVGPYEEIAPAFEKVMVWAALRGLVIEPRFVGVYWDHQEITPRDRTRCEVGLFVDQYAGGDDEVEVRDLPGGEHAVLHCLGPAEHRRRQYDYLYSQWLPERGRVPADRPPYEEYLTPGGDLEKLDLVTNIHVPLAPRRAA